MKKACRSMRRWLGPYADNELDQARADQVVRHLEACADCRHELDQILELNRLAESVEHPRLVDDYWDWQRARVWHGIRNASRQRTPAFRPSFGWARLATVAAGAAVVLLVAVTGWRSFLSKPGPAGPVAALPSRLKSAREVPPAAARGAEEKTAVSQELGPAADVARAKAEGGAGETRGAPSMAERDAGETEVGHAGKGAGATRTAAAPKPTPTTGRGAAHRWESAPERREELAAAPPVGESEVLASSQKESRMVSGPVLLESPPLPQADALDTGTVLLNVETDSAGQVLSAAVRRSSGSAGLDSLAVRQIRQSRFKATVRRNRRVPSSFQYPFRLQKKQVSPQEDREQAPKQQQRQEQRKGKEERKSPEKSDQPTQNNQSEKEDDKEQARPVKEKTKK